MNEQQLVDELDRLVGDVPVGPAPTRASLAPRRPRGRAYAAVALVAAAVVAIAVTAVILRPDGHHAVSPASPVVEPPTGTVWVGRGHAVIAVPRGWSRDQARCGTPVASTVIVGDVPGGLDCLAFPSPGAWVQVRPDIDPGHDATARPTTIDGVAAGRDEVHCASAAPNNGYYPPNYECRASIHIPSENAWFTVAADGRTMAVRADVDAMLDSIRVLPDQVAVPSPTSRDRDAAPFLDELESLGLVADTSRSDAPGHGPLIVMNVEPPSGTVVEPGTTVHVRTRLARPLAKRFSVVYDGPDGRHTLRGEDAIPQHLSVVRGGRITLVSFDPSGSTLDAVVSNARLRSLGDNTWQAVRVGSVELETHTARCLPGGRDCFSTLHIVADLRIRVVPKA